MPSDADTGLTFWMEVYGGWGDIAGDCVKEKGGSTALQGDSQKGSVTYGSLGVHASTPLATVAGLPV